METTVLGHPRTGGNRELSNAPARAAAPPAVLAALADTACLGQYFEFTIGDEALLWPTAADMYKEGMHSLLGPAAARLGATEARVTASNVQFGHAARLWSPVLAAALLHGVVPSLADLRVCPGSPAPLGVPAAAGWAATDPRQIADLAYRVVVTEHLEPLIRGLRVKVAGGLLWGNAASAMVSALSTIATARHGLGPAARPVAELLLAIGKLAGTGRLTGPGIHFRRDSCCLYYRVPDGGTCTNCPLSPPAR
jgi:hypothetical protein